MFILHWGLILELMSMVFSHSNPNSNEFPIRAKVNLWAPLTEGQMSS